MCINGENNSRGARTRLAQFYRSTGVLDVFSFRNGPKNVV